MTWPIAFVLTLSSELPIILLLTRRERWLQVLPWFLVANGTSHPMLWASWGTLWTLCGDYHTTLLVGEAIVYSYEAVIYCLALRSWRGIVLSVAANSASMLLGLLIHGWTG